MSKKRKDSKGRVLHDNEYELADGRYRYKFKDNDGRYQCVHSYRLDKNDYVPAGKKNEPSLREKEHVSTRTGVKATTKMGYATVLNFLKNDSFGQMKINQIKISDVKLWLIKLQNEYGKSFSTIHTIRGVLNPAFQFAVEDDLILKNPFSFKLSDVVYNDCTKRESLSLENEQKFLRFVKDDEHFSKYYEGIYILFNTGLRISEFCGLTVADIDFVNHTIKVDHQLLKNKKDGERKYYIEETKTSCGKRIIPMSVEVEKCFESIISNRKSIKVEPMVDGKTGFLYFDKDGKIMHALHWEKYFRHILDKYNKMHDVQMPRVTPHVCRHTYCSKMAKQGMNVKALQYLMGHSEVDVTLNVYTHISFEDAQAELKRLNVI